MEGLTVQGQVRLQNLKKHKAQEAEAGGSLRAGGQFGLHSEFQDSQKYTVSLCQKVEEERRGARAVAQWWSTFLAPCKALGLILSLKKRD